MGLGSRGAKRHDTAGVQRTAGVNPADYWDFKPGQSVMTVDGFMGKVTAVNDGPIPGTEEYIVTLANNMGGGAYTASQLKAATDHAAAHENTASRDYPELAEILVDRPDPGKYPASTLGMVASRQDPQNDAEAMRYHGRDDVTELREDMGLPPLAEHGVDEDASRLYHTFNPLHADGSNLQQVASDIVGWLNHLGVEPKQASNQPGLCENGHLTWGGDCPGCRNAGDSNAMVVNEGDHKPQDVEKTSAFEPDRISAGWFPITKECEEDPSNHSWCTRHLQYHDFPSDDAMRHEMFPEYGERDGEDGCKTCGASDHSTEMHDAIDDAMHPTQEMAQFMRSNPTGPSKYSALSDPYRLIAESRHDPEFRFHLTAAWRDVRNKAQRIRHEGNVHITAAQNGFIVAQVKGDHGTYESVLMRAPGTQKVGQWDCGCKWATYHWGAPDDHSRFAGRMCSHALALHFEAQARGMFGREIKPNTGVPRWLTQKDVTVTASHEVTPIQTLGMHLVACGEDVEDVQTLLVTMGSVNSPWGEPIAPPVEPLPGPTMPKDPSANPASAGFLTAADPESWSQQQSQGLDRQGSLDEALFEPEMPHTAGPALAIPAIAEGAGVAAGGAEVAGVGAGAAGAGEAGGLGQMLKGLTKVPGVGGLLPSGGGGQKNEAPKDNGGASLMSLEQGSRDAENYLHQSRATLHDEPEPALPSTDGAAEGEDQPHTAAVLTGTEYAVPSDVSANSAQHVAPGLGLKDVSDDTLSPESPSVQTTGSVADIVAEFQRTAGAQGLMSGSGPGAQDSQEIAAAAQQFLQKSAMADFTPAQQQEIINEGEHVTAANLDRLDIAGTHYEALDQARASLDDDEGWMS